MTDRFAELLVELGKVFQMSLHPDKLNACSLSIPPHPLITLQLDEDLEFLFLFSKIIELPPGKFRENVLCEALKANGQPDPRPGIFGYIAMSNTLAIHQKFPAALLNGERIASMIGTMLETASLWKGAIEMGKSSPQIEGISSSYPIGSRP